ncbi:hypothetical protein ACUW9N_002114 [Staphylococcus auricularis]|uniref:Uncharacterized protein n=1 Tax=Staphylococcus auricularis TaxID=29379 RepID=A0AAW7MG83_9STAP|nr:hypothetical protein [Staphylococcus auricularis]MCG7341914.1 hypothetical protein [Staphylococcus auricularis]MDN4534246.1 hypothetical protein [Staphylococcus auricularis]BCU52897.1 hypothetical protein JCM2421_16690 [Staphylococcus auricularis]SQJ14599.1 Uncharacterised protein [Staphylococcus auricularis]
MNDIVVVICCGIAALVGGLITEVTLKNKPILIRLLSILIIYIIVFVILLLISFKFF